MRLCLSILLYCFCLSARAATNTAASCAGPDIQAAVNASGPGDVVIIPACQSNITNSIIVTNAILIIGQGVGQTLLVDTVVKVGANTATEPIFDMEATNSGLYRITGIEFVKGTNGVVRSSDYLNGNIQFNGTAKAIRVDHCQFDQPQARAIRNEGCFGVIDHCTFFMNNEQAIFTGRKTPTDPFGDQAWTNVVVLGTTNCLTVEDCYFQDLVGGSILGKNAIDSQFGGCWTFRYNTVSNSNCGTHGTESGGRTSGTEWYELYANTFNSDGREVVAMDIRSGTGIIATNVCNGIKNYLCRLTANREDGTYPPWGGAYGLNPYDNNDPTGVFTNGTCNGAIVLGQMADTNVVWMVNQWAGYTVTNQESSKFSAIYSNTATKLYYVQGGAGNYGGDCYFTNGNHYWIYRVNDIIDQPGRGQRTVLLSGNPASPAAWPSNVVAAIYSWGNTLNGGIGEANSVSPHVRSGVEYFTSTPKPSYTSLVYPHPLVAVSPTAPSIVLQPQSRTVVEHSSVTLSVIASGTPTLTYQWYEGNKLLAGATTTSYSITHVSLPDTTGTYTVAITNGTGYVISAPATLTLKPAAWWAEDTGWSAGGNIIIR